MEHLLVNKKVREEGDHWLSVSDLMAGLMIVFLFIAIALMRNAMVERDMIKEVAVAYQENQVAIYDSLMEEFTDDLKKWEADIDKETLTFTFNAPDVLFEVGDTQLSQKYTDILQDFFPRYLKVLAPYRDSINEIRIEGHTSSRWNRTTSQDDSYFNNMKLSQGRTRSVLEYVYNLETVSAYKEWIKKHIAAVGFSSAKIITDDNGKENLEKSRRVSFRVITNADVKIKQILEFEQ